MKTNKFSKLNLLLAATAVFVACDGTDGTQDIVVNDGEVLTQSVFADQTGAADITFTTTGAWSSVIHSGGTRAAAEVDWLSIEPDSGDEAGEYTVSVTLKPNTTGEDRAAVVVVSCESSSVTINIGQKGVREDGTSGAVPDGVSLQDALDKYEKSYADMTAAYIGIDNALSWLYGRQMFTADDAKLYEFWKTAYGVINLSNTIVEQVDADAVMSEAEKDEYEGRALLFRGVAYMYLTTLFGNVPFTQSIQTPWTGLPAGEVDAINHFVDENLFSATEKLPEQEAFKAWFAQMILGAQTKKYDMVRAIADGLYSRGALVFDLNGDGLVDASDRGEASTRSFQTCLLGAEALLALGRTADAAAFLNIIYMAHSADILPPPSATADEVREAINNIWPSWNEGMKFMNIVRWGGTEKWDLKYRLLPVPLQTLSENAHLQQNPGW